MNFFIWVDLELTGLEVFGKDKILEIALIVTTSDLKEVDGGRFHAVIHQEDSILDEMNDFCKTLHEKSGLTLEVKRSRISIKEAEDDILKLLGNMKIAPKTAILAGNSVHMDKMFLARYMPNFIDFLNYRIIDIKELCKAWNDSIFVNIPAKKGEHRAITDILESIQELRFYKSTFLNCNKK